MSACRDVLADAFAALGVIALGGEPTVDEIDGGLAAMTSIVLDLHGAWGPLREIDVVADFLASENQRVRVAPGAQVVVTLPNSIVGAFRGRISDYGSPNSAVSCTTGSSEAADGIQSWPPRDGARIEIVGATQALYFYRSDINAWIVANPLTVDGPTPLNARYNGPLAALIAERLCDPMNVSPSPALARRIARGNSALLTRLANARQPMPPVYF